MGGERSAGGPVPWACLGSSPHARGTHGLDFSTDRMSRFIPACAGNAAPAADPAWPPTVHPCMRGERLLMGSRALPSRGSSPHARGTQSFRCCHMLSLRFIPACAGNATTAARTATPLEVHPRMRGERVGSCLRAVLRTRFIPACAGNAAMNGQHQRASSVHPRMRGERTSDKLLIYQRKSESSDSTKHSGC